MRNLILSALLLASAFQTALGQTIFDSGDFQYTLSNSQATVVNYVGGASIVTIPSSLNSYPVVSIGSMAFEGSYLNSVSIPNSVTSIGQGAFYGCIGLTSVSFPSSVKSIGESAFYGCVSLHSVTIPSSVTSIADYAFSSSGLGSVFLSATTTFPSNAFPSTAVFYYGSTETQEAMATQAQLATTQAQLATTQAQLATTQAELAKIKTDLANTKTDLSSYFAKFPKFIKIHLPRSPWSKEKK